MNGSQEGKRRYPTVATDLLRLRGKTTPDPWLAEPRRGLIGRTGDSGKSIAFAPKTAEEGELGRGEGSETKRKLAFPGSSRAWSLLL